MRIGEANRGFAPPGGLQRIFAHYRRKRAQQRRAISAPGAAVHAGERLRPLLRQVIDNNLIRFGEARDICFLHHIVFINRTAAGHYGDLSRLRAAAPWWRIVEARVA